MKKSILVVDDEPQFVDLMTEILEDSGHTVFSAMSVEEAIAQVAKVRVDLVTVDLTMPGRSGTDLLQVMHDIFYGIPCIVISGTPASQMAEPCRELGALGYIEKTDSLTRLKKLVDLILFDW